MSTPAPAAPEGRAPDGPWPRSHSITLTAFLALFALLVVAFREVLFPFLMAIYLAYLVEPVIGWTTRGKTLGFRWGRAPTLILLYVIVFALGFLVVSCGTQKLYDNATRAATDLKLELAKTAPAARVTLMNTKSPGGSAAPSDVWIPAGFELAIPGVGRWKTMFPAQIGEGKADTRVLLEAVGSPGAACPAAGTAMQIVDVKPLELPEGVDASAEADKCARGAELFIAKWFIAPVGQWLEKRTGTHFDPAMLRDFVADQSDKHGGDLGDHVVEWSGKFPLRLFGSMYLVILILMLTAFIVIDRRNIGAFFASLPPPRLQPGYHRLMQYVDRGLAGVIRGQLVICLLNGSLTWVGLQILGVPYAALLAFIAGVFSLIPVFGTIASSIPIVLVALATGGFQSGVLALAWIFLIHLLEANVFNPLIMGTSAEMHPVIIIFALLAGEHAFGVWGALLAVPTASLIQSGFKFFRHEVLRIPDEAPHGHGMWMRRLLARRNSGGTAGPASGGGT